MKSSQLVSMARCRPTNMSDTLFSVQFLLRATRALTLVTEILCVVMEWAVDAVLSHFWCYGWILLSMSLEGYKELELKCGIRKKKETK